MGFVNKRTGLLWGFVIMLCAGALLVRVSSAAAAEREPWELAKSIQDSLFSAQSALLIEDDSAAAQDLITQAAEAAEALDKLPQESQALLQTALDQAAAAVANNDQIGLAGARGLVRGAINWGSYQVTRQSVMEGDTDTARQWLLVREFRPSTRFSRPDADATLALRHLAEGSTTVEEALAQVDADLLDTYQARMAEYMTTAVDSNELATRRAESAGVATAYWQMLVPAYSDQYGQSAADTLTADINNLLPAVVTGDSEAAGRITDSLGHALEGFRAAPLSLEDQARRAGQLVRFLSLVPIEYERGVEGNTVMTELEVQEAVTFMDGAHAAFSDLQPTLMEIDPDQTAALGAQIAQATTNLTDANRKVNVVTPEQMEADISAIEDGLSSLIPSEWTTMNADADFDVLVSVLDQVEAAVSTGDYDLAESARLEGYAIFDSGPEPRLLAFAPPLVAEIDGLFWQGFDGQPGLAQAIALEASPSEVAAIRQQLDEALEEAQITLGDLPSSPVSIISNSGIIVFREGLEAVVILAALTASMVGAYAHYRRPIVLGVVLAFAATVLTWWVAQQIISQLSGFGERLEAVVSLIAIGVLLLITNWFFHKTYWKDWMAGFHAKKRNLLSAETGQLVGLILLGFTSVYREGFETVLFLQALTLEAGATVVLEGVALGLIAVAIVGVLTFKLQKRLPYKKMLVWTGVLIGIVLVTMVGKTIHVMQAVGWMGITPIRGITIPYWAGLWFGVYATWQGIIAQIGAAAFVIGSYYLAEGMQTRKRKQIVHKPHAEQAS